MLVLGSWIFADLDEHMIEKSYSIQASINSYLVVCVYMYAGARLHTSVDIYVCTYADTFVCGIVVTWECVFSEVCGFKILIGKRQEGDRKLNYTPSSFLVFDSSTFFCL